MNALIASICATCTGLCLGIGLKHHFDLQAIVQGATSFSTTSVSDNEAATEIESAAVGDEATIVPSETQGSSSMGSKALSNQLQLIERQQTSMLKQQAEMNRELNAIQFRLDTHSASFRPLRSGNSPSKTQGALQPYPFDNNPLLPPLDQ